MLFSKVCASMMLVAIYKVVNAIPLILHNWLPIILQAWCWLWSSGVLA
jgi:hypothetical protein